MTEQKLNQIEEHIAHQDQQIQDLSDMIIHQGKDIDRLKKHISKLESKIHVIEDSSAEGDNSGASISDVAAREKPPHY